MLEVRDLTVRMGGRKIVDSVSFGVRAGGWLMIAGPNGAGKTTVVSAVAQGVPYTGTVLFRGRDMRRMPGRERARMLGVLCQSHSVGYGFTVAEVVRMGRYSRTRGLLGGGDIRDGEAVASAMEKTGMTPLAGHSVLTLSGGELQRTFLAQLIAQDPLLMILDEPTEHLDLKYRKQIFDFVRGWLSDGDRAVISVVHDLSLAKAYGTRAMLMRGGRIEAEGSPEDVLTPETLRRVYEMDVYGWQRKMLSQWE